MTSSPSWVPNPTQQLLLDACLLDEPGAQHAYHAWRARVDLDQLDTGSNRLLPLLWKRLEGRPLDGQARARFKATYRRAWCFNELALARGARLLGQLAAAGIPGMFLKGAALVLANYGDPGLRPMDDLDVAVPRPLARRAVEVLAGAGWTPGPTPMAGAMASGAVAGGGWTVRPRPLEALDEAYFHARHAHGFDGQAGVSLDLHWCLLQAQCEPGLDDDAWAEAQPVPVRGETALVPSPALHLLLLLAHGSRWNPIPSIRWVADAVTVIRTSPQLAWDRLIAEARARRITLQTGAMLDYLEAQFPVSVPTEVRDRLRASPVGRAERADYRLKTRGPGLFAGLGEMRWLRTRHRAWQQAQPAAATRSFPDYLRHVLDAPSLVDLGRYAASEAFRRLGPGGAA